MDAGPHTVQNDFILTLSEDKKFLQAQFTASIKRKPIELAWLQQKIKDLGLDEAKLNQDAIGQCVIQYNKGNTGSVINIGNCIDGEMKIELSKDNLEAYLTVCPAQGGTNINHDMVMEALQQQGIVFGISEDTIKTVLEKADSQKTLIAKGKPAIHGKNGFFENLIPDAQDRRPRIDKSGKAHYNDIETFVTVKKDDPLIRRHQSTTGEPGCTIKDEAIPATPGEDVMFASDLPGTKISGKDPNLLLSTISGQPVVMDNGAIVEPTITLDCVDSKTGNIEFDGSVLVTGDVMTGMKIKISGDIHINGMIEEATVIEAGGNIRVKKGIVGRGSVFNEDGNPGNGVVQLKADGNITAKFVENTLATAEKDIMVDELVAHSDLRAGANIKVGKTGAKRGHIMGGTTRAGSSVEAEVLGSQASVHTRIKVGINDEISVQLSEINNALDAKNRQRETVEKTYATALRAKNNKKAGFLRNLKAALKTIDSELLAINESKDKIQNEIERLKNAKIIVKRNIFNAVEMQIYTALDKISEEKSGGCYHFENNLVCYKPL